MTRLLLILMGALAALLPPHLAAQTWPTRSVTIIVPFPPGGAADSSARIVAQALGEELRQAVVVDNRAGASGQIGAAAARNATPDGHTLLLADIGIFATNPALYRKLSYDPTRDFQPVVGLVRIPQLLVVPVNSTVQTPADLIAAARQRPGEVSFGSQSVGAGGHIAAEILRAKNDLKLNHVPYKGSAPALQDLVAGRIDFMFDAMPSSLPYVRDARLRAIAIDAPQRSPLLPEVPTLTERELIGYQASPWFGLAAPAGTPAAVIERVQQAAVAALGKPDVLDRLNSLGAVVIGGSSKAFADLIDSDRQRLGKVIAESGIQLD